MNKVVLMGRLTRDPDTRYTQGENSMAISRFTVAVDRRGKKQGGQQNADFPSCKAFGKTAESIQKWLHKGTKICLEGHIQTGSYKSKDGYTVYTTEVIVDNWEFAESKNAGAETQREDKEDESGWMNIPDGIEEELPFK